MVVRIVTRLLNLTALQRSFNADPLQLSREISELSGGVPPTSNGRSRQHMAFVITNTRLGGTTTTGDGQNAFLYEVTVYPVVSFTRNGGAIAHYPSLDPLIQARLIPLPNLSTSHPTWIPPAFGAAIDLGGRTTTLPSFLSLKAIKFRMHTGTKVSHLLYT